MGSLVAVVVTYNRLAKLKVTLARLLDADPVHLKKIVVVDNHSTDDTIAWLQVQSDPRLDVIELERNIGGAGGFEIGMREAVLRHDPDWLLVMDDDARPEPDTLALFHASNPQVDGVAAAVYLPSGEICGMNAPSNNPFWHWRDFLRTALRGRKGFHVGPDAYQGPARQVDVASFVGLFLSRRAVDLIGYPDPDFFIYTDDTLYTLELTAAGGRIMFDPALRFEHDMGTFGGAADGRQFTPIWKVYYYHRNLLMLYRRVAGWFFWVLLPLVLTKWVLRVFNHPGQKRLFLGLLRRAIWDGLRGRISVDHDQVLAWAAAGGDAAKQKPELSSRKV